MEPVVDKCSGEAFSGWGLLCSSFLFFSGDGLLNTFPRFGLFFFSSRPLPPGLCTGLADLGLRFQGVVLNAVTIDDMWQGWKGGGSLERLAPPK